MKIPRRTLFVAQLIACILGTLTQSKCSMDGKGPFANVCKTVSCCGCSVMSRMFALVVSLTTSPARKVELTITVLFSGEVCFTSSEPWVLESLHCAAIGPARLYNIGQRYSGLLNMFWIGAALPIITFFLRKKFPKSRFLHAIHWPIFFAGTGNLPPAVCINLPKNRIVN